MVPLMIKKNRLNFIFNVSNLDEKNYVWNLQCIRNIRIQYPIHEATATVYGEFIVPK